MPLNAQLSAVGLADLGLHPVFHGAHALHCKQVQATVRTLCFLLKKGSFALESGRQS